MPPHPNMPQNTFASPALTGMFQEQQQPFDAEGNVVDSSSSISAGGYNI